MKSLKFKVTFKEHPEPDYSVPVTEMKRGQVGVITRYRRGGVPLGPVYEGTIVSWGHKLPDVMSVPVMLVELAARNGLVFPDHRPGGPDLGTRVRILKDGDALVAGKDGALTVKWAEGPAKDPTVPVRDLKPGQAGVIITGWRLYPWHDGEIVVRTSAGADRIQLLGEANGWGPVPVDDRCRVRPIGPGDRLEAVGEDA